MFDESVVPGINQVIHAVGTADEVGVFVFEFAPADGTDTGVEIVQELRLQRLA
ncbi:hypothetical protein D3C81_1947570 [compost metagenome]